MIRAACYSALLAAVVTVFSGLWFGREITYLDKLQFWILMPGLYITMFATHTSIHRVDFRIVKGVTFVFYFCVSYTLLFVLQRCYRKDASG